MTGTNKFGSCLSKTDAVFILPDTPLTVLNPWLTTDSGYQALIAAGCGLSRDAGSVCHDKPAIGSGLAQLRPNYFLGLTDRGPNQDCEDLFDIDQVKYADAQGKDGKGFPVRAFAPTIVHFRPSKILRVLDVIKTVPLRGSDGAPISGISNTPADDTPYGLNCAGNRIPFDPSGLDTEDLAPILGTKYAVIVDEYAPSVVLANYETGEIIARHVPASVKDALAGASYPIIGDLPSVYSNRRKARGFEGVVVDKKRQYVIAIMQSPMLGFDASKTENNAIIRCAYFDLTVTESGIPSLRYSRTFVIEASSPDAYESANAPKDLKYSGGFHFKTGRFIALERAKGQVKLFKIDFRKATNIDDTRFADNLDLEGATNGVKTAKQMGVRAAKKVMIWESVEGIGGSVGFTGDSKQEGFVLDSKDRDRVWMMNDNDFGLEGKEHTEMRQISLGRAARGATVCQLPQHPPAPAVNVTASKEIKLENSQTYRISDVLGAGAAENLDVDEDLSRAYVANDDKGSVDMYDVSVSPAVPMSSYFPGIQYKPTSIAVCKSLDFIAISLANAMDDAASGRVDILTKDMQVFKRIQRRGCILPDTVKWSDDCKFLVAACEGEGAAVPGGIMVVDFNGPPENQLRGVSVANFRRYDQLTTILERNGIRLIESKMASLDFEPEFVAISGKNAFVTLQEANAIAIVDLYEAAVTEIKPIGYIDRRRGGFALDASDKDNGINIRNYPFLFGMPQPDTIGKYTGADGQVYLIFINEGDSKDSEEARGKDIIDPGELGRNAVPGLKNLLEDDASLGRLKISTIMGYNATTNTQENVFHYGSRSFSIMAIDGRIVFDSGEWLAQILKRHFPAIFNSNGFDGDDLNASQADLFDNRYVCTRHNRR